MCFIRHESHIQQILVTGVKQMSWKVLEYKVIFPPVGFRSTQPPTEESWERPLSSSLKNNRGLHHPAESAGNHYMTVAFDGRVETGYIRCSYDASTGCSASVMYFLWLVSYVTFKSCYYWSMIYYEITAAGLPDPYRKSYMLGFTKKSCGFTVKKY